MSPKKLRRTRELVNYFLKRGYEIKITRQTGSAFIVELPHKTEMKLRGFGKRLNLAFCDAYKKLGVENGKNRK